MRWATNTTAKAASSAKPETGKVIPFNPLERKHLGASVAQELLRQRGVPLGQLPKFEGAGVYAIYYKGDFAPYKQLADANKGELRLPIYVGKAIPEGGRTGVETGEAKSRLRGRLQEHASSIRKVGNLKIEDLVYKVGPKLELEAGRETFVGNEQANRLLTRQSREGFVVPNLAPLA